MCPVCREPMMVVELQGVELDHCPQCHGTWFDSGELEFLTEAAGAAETRLGSALLTGVAVAGAERRCPRCRRTMAVVRVGAQPPIEVDRCRQGHGVWLDVGELGGLVRAFSGSSTDAIANFLGDLFRHELGARAQED